jgi:hypothetical protein
MIHELNTGYRPSEATLTDAEKRELFNKFAKWRYVLRKTIKASQDLIDLKRSNRATDKRAIKSADFTTARLARNVRKDIDRLTDQIESHKAEAIVALLGLARWIEKAATLDEKAALLGMSTTAARLALKPYTDRCPEKSESFLMLLTSAKRDTAFEDVMFDAVLDRVMDDPIGNRQTTQHLNKLLGSDFFPLPIVPKPTLVKADRDGGAA